MFGLIPADMPAWEKVIVSVCIVGSAACFAAMLFAFLIAFVMVVTS